MRNMSFALTTPQFVARTKTVTRRMGWWFLNPNDLVCGVEKGMGLKKGEKIKRLGVISIVCTKPERLWDITQEDVIAEGFPEMTPTEFVNMFIRHNGCSADELINRIQFKYTEEKI